MIPLNEDKTKDEALCSDERYVQAPGTSLFLMLQRHFLQYKDAETE